ncbi:MAG: NAD-binding protein [Sedimentibacter saalensis]|uniref:potassium channel family protein n=1 Tax=Sedimentibacter saalensis TaxID=130788 RepID=UPI002B21B0E7|nr:NAD-binding protein [Sedimentibacter saalensis]MEA5095641.1 NAD-binding protein [Sedimentibacter saalensis]
MNIFKKQNKELAVIAGCGEFGSKIAVLLQKKNMNVHIIDIDENSFSNLSPEFDGFTITGDAADIDLLEFAGAGKASIIIAATNDDNTNIMIGQMSKHLYKADEVVVRIYDSAKKFLCADMDITSICPCVLSENEFKRIISDKESIAV